LKIELKTCFAESRWRLLKDVQKIPSQQRRVDFLPPLFDE